MTWILKEVDKEECDICGSWATVNVYRRQLTCTCSKCTDTRMARYEYFYVCGYCFTGWAKANAQYLSIDDVAE
jgi:hypothetical protein